MDPPSKHAAQVTSPDTSTGSTHGAGAVSEGWLAAVWAWLSGQPGASGSLDRLGWLALAQAREPTPAAGPLRHDLLVRTGGEPESAGRYGLNVFSRDAQQDAEVLGLLRAQAQRWGCRATVEQLCAQLPAGLRYHGGFVCGAGGEVLKLYLAADEQQPARGVIKQAMGVLGIARADEALALGIDLSPSGWMRARSYRLWDRSQQAQRDNLPASNGSHEQGLAGHSCAWQAAVRWQALVADGIAHRVLAQLDGAQAHDGLDKRSYDIIFTPDATLAGLFEVAAAVAALDPLCIPHYDAAQLLQVDQQLQAQGLTLRPAAYEVDVFADGRRTTDTLLTIGVRSSSRSASEQHSTETQGQTS